MPEPELLDDAEVLEPFDASPGRLRRMLSVLASLTVPGAGQFSLGYWGRGVLWYLAFPVALMASSFTPWPSTVIIADVLAGLIVRLASAVDAALLKPTTALPGWRRVLAAWVLLALGAWVWTYAWQRLYSYRVYTDVMADTLIAGDRILVDSRAYVGAEPRRGDLVSIGDRFRRVMLRVVAVGGDTVQMQHHRVLVGGQLVDEPYRDATPAPAAGSEPCVYLFGCEPLQVPAGTFFALGDNRELGQDSRYWGVIPREKISGKPVVIYWSAVPSPGRSDRLDIRPSGWGRLGTWLR